ncbi:alkaline phosphatase synthesis transcriptional regulatory protein PhoP [archaeon BMS3Abin16]|nr:alkaline phosphatase synthesis transcriptional regulatory protein PhoP [archaeon BMS3Abin16]GBE55819.1 alkaline phosphatase synthesis transcriptional regulatory protein PhoP [archaeon BMS3Bbin16]HDY74251.1 response regulator [Euryarchaeota archaeon]
MKKKILVVDDESDIIYILKTVLSRRGYAVINAGSGEECLKVVKSERPDLIFMDIMMDGMDGWEAARRIKTDPKTRDIPISMLSVKSWSDDRKKSREYAYADMHLKKPIDFGELLDTTENMLSREN